MATGHEMARWEGIDEFLKVVEPGSFTTAARLLGVSKSYVSKQVNLLEDRLQARLLQRTTRKLTLTDSGEVFYRQCQLMSQQFEQAEAAIAEMQQKLRGTLKLAINSRFGVRYMAGAVAAFSRLHPALNVEVHSSFSDVDLIAGGYDLTIRYGRLEDSSLIARKLGTYTLSLCASPAYWKCHGQPESPEDLRQHNCLGSADRYWLFDSGADEPLKVKVSGNWVSEDGATLMAAAKEGIGVAQLPDFYIRQAVEAGELVKLHSSWSRYWRETWAVYPHGRHLSAKVRLFVDFLAGYMQQELSPKRELFVADTSIVM
ncbi:MAG: LysR family transcriptional regulator [Gammaproteobacteria bacterium]|nr:LysR family transcriptional regulator [Gammaproteobacteria bacterium]